MAGTPGPHRTKALREEHRTQLAEWYVTGVSQEEMGRRLGISRSLVYYDLTVVVKRWQERQIAGVDARRAAEEQKLLKIEHEAWEAYERSKHVRTVTKRSKKTKGVQSAAMATGELVAEVERNRVKTTEELIGDKGWLELARQCVADRRKMFGLDAPVKVAPTNIEGTGPARLDINVLSDDQKQQALDLYRAIRDRQSVN